MKLHVQLFEKHLPLDETFTPTGHTAVWEKESGGFYAGPNQAIGRDGSSSLLCFHFDRHAAQDDMLLSSTCEWPSGECILRLDTVTFPPSAIAYRHVHAGPGTRYLVRGGLEIRADDHVDHMLPGDVWFEGSNSPVRATAIDGETSQFIRAMVLPLEFEGKPTITFLNPDDFDKPKLQTNHRFFDSRITL